MAYRAAALNSATPLILTGLAGFKGGGVFVSVAVPDLLRRRGNYHPVKSVTPLRLKGIARAAIGDDQNGTTNLGGATGCH